MRTTARTAVTTALTLLGASALASCGSSAPQVPTAEGAVCGDPVPSAGVTLEGLTEEDVLLVESSFGLEDTVVYRDGRVAVVGYSAADWARATATSSSTAAPAVDAGRADLPAPVALLNPGGATRPVHPPERDAVVLPAMAWIPHTGTPYLLVGTLPDCALEELEQLAVELGVVGARTNGDLGDPMVTDQSTTVIDYRGESAVEIGAYALLGDFEEGLTRDERAGRAYMRSMLDTVRWNLPDVVEIAPTAVEVWEGWSTCEGMSDPAAVARVLEEFELDGEVTARAVQPGIEPCS